MWIISWITVYFNFTLMGAVLVRLTRYWLIPLPFLIRKKSSDCARQSFNEPNCILRIILRSSLRSRGSSSSRSALAFLQSNSFCVDAISSTVIGFYTAPCIYGDQLFVQLNLRDRVSWRGGVLRRIINVGDQIWFDKIISLLKSSRYYSFQSRTRICF